MNNSANSHLDEIEARKSASFRAFDKWRFGARAGYSDTEAYRTRLGKENWPRKDKTVLHAESNASGIADMIQSVMYPTPGARERRKLLAIAWQNAAREKQEAEHGRNIALREQKSSERKARDHPWFIDKVYWSYPQPDSSQFINKRLQGRSNKNVSYLENRFSDSHFQLLNAWLDGCDDHSHDQGRGNKLLALPKRLLHVGCPKHLDELSIISVDELGPAVRFDLESKHPFSGLPSLADTLFEDCKFPGSPPPQPRCSQKRRIGPYLTLSHRWGGPYQEYWTMKANIDPRSISLPYASLPPTFQDAITTTRRLGFEYLWIDSLCIVQDDPDELHAEMKKMEDIYSGAACTIAATSASGCTDGFLRRDPTLDIRTEQQRSDDPTDTFVIAAASAFGTEIEGAELNTRGWILQERALSRRTLHFGRAQNYWECGEGLLCEAVRGGYIPSPTPLSTSAFPLLSARSLHTFRKSYAEILTQVFTTYSALHLTHAQDRIWALTGLEYRLARIYPSYIIYGVVSVLLHETLLWKPCEERSMGCMRRIDFGMGKEGGAGEAEGSNGLGNGPPSWSWMAYTGAISYVKLPSFVVYMSVRFEFEERTKGCALRCEMWRVPQRVTADSGHVGFLCYDDGRSMEEEEQQRDKVWEFVPLVQHKYRLTYGLLVEEEGDAYVRVGVAAFARECAGEKVAGVRVI